MMRWPPSGAIASRLQVAAGSSSSTSAVSRSRPPIQPRVQAVFGGELGVRARLALTARRHAS